MKEVIKIRLKYDSLKSDLNFMTVHGQFFPEQMSSKLYMSVDEAIHKYQIAFHERFHYLQCIFTPYGHLKWGSNRTFISDVLDIWLNQNANKKIPVVEYLESDSNSLKILYSIMMKDFAKRISDITTGLNVTVDELKLIGIANDKCMVPEIKISDKFYTLNGIDIIESFAKYEEAILAFLAENKDINDTINPDLLHPRYYAALYYFIEQIGMNRLEEFPIACELALGISHLPRANDKVSMRNYHPAWRFVKIVDFLKNNKLNYNIFENETFWEYTTIILKGCNFDEWDELWYSAEEYAKQCDLTMSQEMLVAIEYKKAHPWCLSYPMANIDEFLGEKFNRFHPLFTITDNEVFYNVVGVNQSEILFENEIQSLVNQIIGYKSKYNLYPNSIQCADNYFGIKSCKYWLDGACDGHLCKESKIPQMVLDDEKNIIDGCMLEICLNILGTSIKEILIGKTGTKIDFSELLAKIKAVQNDLEGC